MSRVSPPPAGSCRSRPSYPPPCLPPLLLLLLLALLPLPLPARSSSLPAMARRPLPLAAVQRASAALDEMNGGLPAHRARVQAAAASPSYLCSGVCCSSAGAVAAVGGRKAMTSRWPSNLMFQGARIQLWTYDSNTFWGPANNRTGNWSGAMAAWRGQAEQPPANSMRVERLNATAIRLRTPGNGFLEAAPIANGYGPIQVNFKATSAAVFTFERVGVGMAHLKTAYGTYISWGEDERLYHWGDTAGGWETFRVFETMAVPAFRGPNIGSWLFPERWMVPDLWKGVPNFMDGTQVYFRSLTTSNYVSLYRGLIKVDGTKLRHAVTLNLRRVSTPNGPLQLRTFTGAYLTATGGGGGSVVTTNTLLPGKFETFTLHFSRTNYSLVMLQTSSGKFLRTNGLQLVADVPATAIDFNSAAAWRGNTVFTITVTRVRQTNYQLFAGLGINGTRNRIKRHLNTWFTWRDFAWLQQQGVTAIRIPIGHWVTQMNNPDPPYPPGWYVYLDWAFKMALKYGIRIFVSLHSAPGSCNDLETRDFVVEFGWAPGTVEKMLAAVEWVAARYGSNPMFAGLNVMNEPFDDIPSSTLSEYYTLAFQRVRKHSQCAFVAFMTRLGASVWEFWQYPGRPDGNNVIVDYHFYKIFGNSLLGRSPENVTNIVRTDDAAFIKTVQDSKKWMVLIGEFCNGLPVAPANIDGYKQFAKAQIEVFGRATDAGWFFWSYKQGPNSGVTWGFRYGVDNGIIVRENGVWP